MNKVDIYRIQSQVSDPSVSIFLPTKRVYSDRSEFDSSINNIMKQVQDTITKSYSKNLATTITQSIEKQLKTINTRNLLDGLAIFANENFVEKFLLPIPVGESIVVSNRFSTRNLLFASTKMSYYWLLVITEPSVNLYFGTDHSLVEYQDDGFPFKNVVQESPVERKTSSQVAATASTRSEMQRAAGATHLAGDYKQDVSIYDDEHLKQFLRKVGSSIDKAVQTHKAPLILIGTDRNIATFKKLGVCKTTAAGVLQGSHNKTSLPELADLAKPELEEILSKNTQVAIGEFEEARDRKNTATGIQEVWQVAKENRCKTLLVEHDYYCYAKKSESGLSLDMDNSMENGIDNVEETMLSVLKASGDIVFLEKNQLQKDGRIAAILRY